MTLLLSQSSTRPRPSRSAVELVLRSAARALPGCLAYGRPAATLAEIANELRSLRSDYDLETTVTIDAWLQVYGGMA